MVNSVVGARSMLGNLYLAGLYVIPSLPMNLDLRLCTALTLMNWPLCVGFRLQQAHISTMQKSLLP